MVDKINYEQIINNYKRVFENYSLFDGLENGGIKFIRAIKYIFGADINNEIAVDVAPVFYVNLDKLNPLDIRMELTKYIINKISINNKPNNVFKAIDNLNKINTSLPNRDDRLDLFEILDSSDNIKKNLNDNILIFAELFNNEINNGKLIEGTKEKLKVFIKILSENKNNLSIFVKNIQNQDLIQELTNNANIKFNRNKYNFLLKIFKKNNKKVKKINFITKIKENFKYKKLSPFIIKK